MTLAYVGVGSNLDDPCRHVNAALSELGTLPQTQLLMKSSLYRSAPVGYADQPDFINAVAALDTGLVPKALLRELQGLEARHGRNRSFRNAPRKLDLDLLLYGDAAHEEAGLSVPHPRMHERAFVLQPLVEIAPGLSIPGRGSAQECLAACPGQEVEKVG